MSGEAENNKRVAGVMGGLGPGATVDFMDKVLRGTRASCDQDHIRMLVDHNPTVPDRHDAIAGNSPGIGPQLAAMASGLERSGADFLVLVCNTAHAYTDDIRAAVTIPFVSIIDVCIEALSELGVQQVGVMAARGCLQAKLYQDALCAAGYQPVLWTDSELEEFMELVYRVKAGDRDPEIGACLSRLATSLVFSGAEVLIAGCTEIPLMLSDTGLPVPLLSSTDLLVERTIKLAQGVL